MRSVSCALVELRRKKSKYIILFIIFTILFTALLSGKILCDSVFQMREKVLMRIGACLEIRGQDEEGKLLEIPNEWKTEIGNMQYVEGMNQHFSDYVFLKNAENVKIYTGANPDEQTSKNISGLDENMVVLDANLNCKWIDGIRKKDMVLLDGEYPSEEKKGILIEQHLAEKNSIDIGDEMELRSKEGKEAKALVVGIYKTKGVFKITEDNFAGKGVFAWSPYNRIYSNLEFGSELLKKEKNNLPLHVYVKNLELRTYVMKNIEQILKEKKEYTVSDETKESYNDSEESYQIEVIENYARMIMLYSLLIGLVLLSLVLNLYLQYYYKDAGILIAMGAGRWRIIGQFLIAMGIVILMAGAASIGVTSALIKKIVDLLMEKVTFSLSIIASFEDDLSDPIPFTVVYPGKNTYFICGLTVVLFWGASCIPLLLKMIRFCPRSLWGKDER